MKRISLLLLVGLLTGSPCLSGTYYVATNGVDAVSRGSADLPFRTIQYGVATANPGDVVIVNPGIYPEKILTVRGGSNAAPIRIKGSDGTRVYQFTIKHSWITVEGFTLTGVGAAGYEGSFYISRNTHDIAILSNTISAASVDVGGIRCESQRDDIPSVGNLSIIGNSISNCLNHGLVLRGSNALVKGNVFAYNNGFDAMQVFGSNHRITQNHFVNISHSTNNNNHPDLIQTFGPGQGGSHDVMVDCNYAIDCGGQGIRVTADGDPNIRNWTLINNVFINQGAATVMLAASNCLVLNNTFINCTRNTAHPVSWIDSAGGLGANGACYYNVFVGCGSSPESVGMGFFMASGRTTNTFSHDYNFVAGPSPTYAAKKTSNDAPQWLFTDVHGINGGNPLFTSWAKNNFRPVAASPLVGVALATGTSIPGLSPLAAEILQYDHDLNLRPGPDVVDIGAYKGSAAAAPMSPSNLHVPD